MKLINPIGRNVEKIAIGDVYSDGVNSTPRGCTCSSTYKNYTSVRKGASCNFCKCSCADGSKNSAANNLRASNVNTY